MVEILYLDESGDDGKTPNVGGKSKTKHFVIGGVVVKPDYAKEIAQRLNDLWEDIRQERREMEGRKPFAVKMSRLPYFHMTDLLCGKGDPWKYFDYEVNRAVIYKVLDIIMDCGGRFTGDVMDKESHFGRWGSRAWPPFNFLMADQLGRFQRDLDADDSVGLVVMDSQGHHREKDIRKDYENWVLNGTTLSGRSGLKPQTLDNVIDVVMFSPSKYTPGLQAADFAAGILFQKFERGNNEFYDHTLSAWKRPRRGHDPSFIR